MWAIVLQALTTYSLDRFGLALFAVPIFVCFCGQVFYNTRLQLRKSKNRKTPPLFFAWNAVRAGLFSVLLLAFAIMCPLGVVGEPQQRIFGAVFRLVMIAWPTTFIAKSPFRKIVSAAGLKSSDTTEAAFDSESNIDLVEREVI